MKSAKRAARRAAQRRYRRVMLFVGVFCLILSGVLAVGMTEYRSKNQEYGVKEAELTRELDVQRQREENLDSYASYVQSEEYTRETAKEKLGLQEPGEIIFRPEK